MDVTTPSQYRASSLDAYHWKILPAEGLAWRHFDGDYLAFNPASGNTHVLDVASGEILKFLSQAAASSEAVGTRLAAFLEVDEDDNLRDARDEMLLNLEELALIERYR